MVLAHFFPDARFFFNRIYIGFWSFEDKWILLATGSNSEEILLRFCKLYCYIKNFFFRLWLLISNLKKFSFKATLFKFSLSETYWHLIMMSDKVMLFKNSSSELYIYICSWCTGSSKRSFENLLLSKIDLFSTVVCVFFSQKQENFRAEVRGFHICATPTVCRCI